MGVTGTGGVKVVRVALIGAGYMSTEHARAFASIPGVSVVGIHSRTRARAEALAADVGIPLVADSVDELFRESGATLVVVSVPELEMRGVAEACFAHPWTVLLEKPAGYDHADATTLAAAAAGAGRQVFVALNRRFYSSTREIARALANHPGPRFIKVQDQEDPEQALAGGQPPLVVANWMYANAIHLIDYFRIFGRGRITKVTPVVPWNPAAPGVVVAHIAFDSGDQGLYEGYWNAPAPWSVSVTTPAERWELRPIEQASVQKRGERRALAIEVDPHDTSYKPGLRAQAEAAVAAVRGEPNELTTIGDALESMRLTKRIFGL